MNVLAQNLGIFDNSANILARLVEKYATDQDLVTVAVPSLEIDGRIGFLFADGAAVRMLDAFYQIKTGALGAAWMVTRIGIGCFWRIVRTLYPAERGASVEGRVVAQVFSSLGIFASTLLYMPYRLRMFSALAALSSSRSSGTTRHHDVFQIIVVTAPSKMS